MANSALAPFYLVDFDGVVCDSRLECMVTSYVAYSRVAGREPALAFDAGLVAPAAAERFVRYRYLVRTAREFSLLWDMIESGAEIRSDRWLREQTAVDEDRLLRFHEAFYEVRYEWMELDMPGWLGIHRVFPVMSGCLVRWLAQGRAHIVSSKDSRSILTLLRHGGVELPDALVSGCEGGDKAEHLIRLRRTLGRELVFIDDNLENLRIARENEIAGYLAEWGYVSNEVVAMAREEGFPVLSLAGLERLQ